MSKRIKPCGSRHCSVVLSAPTILRPRVGIPTTIELWCEKVENTQKETGIGPYLITNLAALQTTKTSKARMTVTLMADTTSIGRTHDSRLRTPPRMKMASSVVTFVSFGVRPSTQSERSLNMHIWNHWPLQNIESLLRPIGQCMYWLLLRHSVVVEKSQLSFTLKACSDYRDCAATSD